LLYHSMCQCCVIHSLISNSGVYCTVGYTVTTNRYKTGQHARTTSHSFEDEGGRRSEQSVGLWLCRCKAVDVSGGQKTRIVESRCRRGRKPPSRDSRADCQEKPRV